MDTGHLFIVRYIILYIESSSGKIDFFGNFPQIEIQGFNIICHVNSLADIFGIIKEFRKIIPVALPGCLNHQIFIIPFFCIPEKLFVRFQH